ncbi:unnamed protein product, partial [Trichogramma brassicae]
MTRYRAVSIAHIILQDAISFFLASPRILSTSLGSDYVFTNCAFLRQKHLIYLGSFYSPAKMYIVELKRHSLQSLTFIAASPSIFTACKCAKYKLSASIVARAQCFYYLGAVYARDKRNSFSENDTPGRASMLEFASGHDPMAVFLSIGPTFGIKGYNRSYRFIHRLMTMQIIFKGGLFIHGELVLDADVVDLVALEDDSAQGVSKVEDDSAQEVPHLLSHSSRSLAFMSRIEYFGPLFQVAHIRMMKKRVHKLVIEPGRGMCSFILKITLKLFEYIFDSYDELSRSCELQFNASRAVNVPTFTDTYSNCITMPVGHSPPNTRSRQRLKNTESSRSDPPLLVVAKQPVAPTSTPQEIGKGSLPPSPERNIRDEQADQDSLAIEQQDEPHRPREPLPQQQQPDQLEPLQQQQQQQPPVQVDQINPLPLEMANQLPPALNSWEAFTQALMAHRPSLPEYNGLDHENPTSYLTKCDEYCTALQIPDEQKLSVLEKGLKGSAEKWWQCYKSMGLTYARFSELLKAQYDGQALKSSLMAKLCGTTQGEKES